MPDPQDTSSAGLRMDARTVRLWCAAAVQALGAHRDEIDRLNVFPVPDGDTGTNMLLTLRAMTDALRRERPAALASAAAVMARGALLGARGNSGVILSQFVRGMAEVLGDLADDRPITDAPTLLAAAIRRGAMRARAGVADPSEGTILTVADRAADAATEVAVGVAKTMAGVAAVTTAAAAAAADAVHKSTQQLDVLRRAGVVDAGGRGLSIILDALAVATGGAPAGGLRWAHSDAHIDEQEVVPESVGPQFEVVYLLDLPTDAAGNLAERMQLIGDSVVIATADESADLPTHKVHVHTRDVGAAIELGIAVGRPHSIQVSHLVLHEDPDTDQTAVGVVAIAPGDALRDVFAAEGAQVVNSEGTRKPSTAEVLAAIERSNTPRVIVLPNDGDCAAVADAAADVARSKGIEVAVVPTKSVVQGLAALAVHDEERHFGDDAIAMAEAAAATRYAEVTVAAREALTMAGPCEPGDVLGLVGSDVVTIGPSILEVTISLLDLMLATGGELVTLVIGRRAPYSLADDLEADLTHRHPEIELLILPGGHPDRPVILGVE